VDLTAPFAGTVIAIAHQPDEHVPAGAAVVILEAMKMEHEIVAAADGVVSRIDVAVGDTVEEGQRLAVLAESDGTADGRVATEVEEVEERHDLEAVRARHALTEDEARPDAVAKRREKNRRTARENLRDLVDEGTFVEYGPLIFAAQEQRRSRQELIERTPADGLVAGVGEIEGRAAVVMSYDYTVLAGTQGMRNHQKKDRLFEVAE
jgi:pyruvate/2-oxoglutarate dehydrogenase complex dihydrolipoamide acyltransferase (E2) component